MIKCDRVPSLVGIIPAALVVASSACSYTQGYAGPARGKDEVARVRFSGSGPVRLHSSSINEISEKPGTRGIAVLPGKHSIEISYSIDRDFCSPFTQLCTRKRHRGLCRTKLEAKDGATYRVRVIDSNTTGLPDLPPDISMRVTTVGNVEVVAELESDGAARDVRGHPIVASGECTIEFVRAWSVLDLSFDGIEYDC